jgi:hypothetical protein
MDADVTQRILYRPSTLRALRDGEDGPVEHVGPFRKFQRRPADAGPPPRYDDVYREGAAYADALARGEVAE